MIMYSDKSMEDFLALSKNNLIENLVNNTYFPYCLVQSYLK